MMQTADGQIKESYSIAAFPSVGPQHAYPNRHRDARCVSITDDERWFQKRCAAMNYPGAGVLPRVGARSENDARAAGKRANRWWSPLAAR